MNQFNLEIDVSSVHGQTLPKALSPAACHLRDGLTQRLDKFESRLMRCQEDFTEENIHDLRVSTRRLMVILAMCKAVLPTVKSKGLRKELKLHLDSLDGVRDTQVMLLFLKKNFRKNDAAVPLSAYLLLEETRLHRRLGFEIGLIQKDSLSQKVYDLRSSLETTLTGTGVADQILAVVDEAFAVVQWKKVNVSSDNPTSFHPMRIAFKKFRYMLEVAEPLVPPMPPTRSRTLHRFQGMMGDIQDMVVFLGFLDRFGLENPQFDITQVRNFALKKRDERISHFIARINQLNLFWRKSPVVRFPWRQPVTSQVMEKLEEIEDE
jgi:CHAD domain-containing protein